MKNIIPWFIALVLLLAPGILIGCDNADANSEDVTTGEGHVRIVLKDAPAQIVSAFVTIERIEFLGEFDEENDGEDEDGDFVIIFDEPETLDLLTLQDGVTVTLVDTEVPFGNYHQIRWYVGDDAYVVLDDGETLETEMDLKIPSGKVKIQLPEFEVDDSEDFIEILFDFDVQESFVERGNSGKGFIFKPTIKPVNLVINGEVVDLSGLNDDND